MKKALSLSLVLALSLQGSGVYAMQNLPSGQRVGQFFKKDIPYGAGAVFGATVDPVWGGIKSGYGFLRNTRGGDAIANFLNRWVGQPSSVGAQRFMNWFGPFMSELLPALKAGDFRQAGRVVDKYRGQAKTTAGVGAAIVITILSVIVYALMKPPSAASSVAALRKQFGADVFSSHAFIAIPIAENNSKGIYAFFTQRAEPATYALLSFGYNKDLLKKLASIAKANGNSLGEYVIAYTLAKMENRKNDAKNFADWIENNKEIFLNPAPGFGQKLGGLISRGVGAAWKPVGSLKLPQRKQKQEEFEEEMKDIEKDDSSVLDIN